MAEMTLPSGHVVLIDDEDAERVSRHRWHLHPRVNGDPYVKAYMADVKGQLLHRYLLGITDPKVGVDHRNGDTLDCRKGNLRVATQGQNMANAKAKSIPNKSSKYKGVSRHPFGWRARIKLNYQQISLGVFASEEQAARAYDEAAKKHFGEFSRPNFGD